MFSIGWAAEVSRLMATVPPSAIAWKSCGYERLRAAIVAGEPPEALRDEIVRETWQYARRQRTWFRTQLPAQNVFNLDPTEPDAIERAAAWWLGVNDT